MTFYNNSKPFAPGTMANPSSPNDWVFHGNTYLNRVYEGSFEADIDALADSTWDDSGYFSNDADYFEARNADIARHDGPSPSYLEAKSSVHSDTYVNVPASDKPNGGSLYNGAQKRSATHLEKDTSSRKQRKEMRRSKTLYHPVYEKEHTTTHKYSTVKTSNAPRPLEQWASSFEHHEWIAYQMQQPPNPQSSKKHETAGRK